MMKNGQLQYLNCELDFAHAVSKWQSQARGCNTNEPHVGKDALLIAAVLMNAMVDSVKGSCFNPETHVDITPRQFENGAKEIICKYQEKLDDLLSEFNDDFSAFCDKAMGKEV